MTNFVSIEEAIEKDLKYPISHFLESTIKMVQVHGDERIMGCCVLTVDFTLDEENRMRFNVNVISQLAPKILQEILQDALDQVENSTPELILPH